MTALNDRGMLVQEGFEWFFDGVDDDLEEVDTHGDDAGAVNLVMATPEELQKYLKDTQAEIRNVREQLTQARAEIRLLRSYKPHPDQYTAYRNPLNDRKWLHFPTGWAWVRCD